VRRLNRFSFSLLVFPKTERHTRDSKKNAQLFFFLFFVFFFVAVVYVVDSLSHTQCVLFTRVLLCIAWNSPHSLLLLLLLPLLSGKKQVPHRGGYSRDDISRHRKLIRAD